MRAVSLAVVALLVGWSTFGFSQPGTPALVPPPTTAPAPLPSLPNGSPVSNPVPVPSNEPPVLAGGTDVSSPLRPVVVTTQVEPTAPKTDKPEPVPADEDRNPRPGKVLGNWWDNDELLIWWPKAHPVPALITGNRFGTPPVLGAPNTIPIVGGHSIANQDIAGYRLTLGWSLNKADTVGFEGRYFFLGTRTSSEIVGDIGNSYYRALGFPYTNALTGNDDVFTFAEPGVRSSLMSVSTSTRVQGAEANAIANLYATNGMKIHAIAGYRFFQLNEGLRIEQHWLDYPTGNRAQLIGTSADQFDARNEFHGGQLGLMADWHRGPFYIEWTGKIALGQNYQVVWIDGETHTLQAANPFPIGRSMVGGIYAQPTNRGRFTRSTFAVVPEGMFKVGFKTGDRGRFYVGYNFLYLSDAIRPGDQIDRTINPAQLALLGGNPGFPGPERPRALIKSTDFWVQGLLIGFEARF